MAYTKTNWVNGQAPALSAENLNKMEQGIYDNSEDCRILNTRVAANKLDGSRITLDSYTSSDYTFPSDGYLSVTAGAASNAQASVSIKDATGAYIAELGGLSNGGYPSWGTFVTKGMKVRVTVANDGHVYFSPMTL